MVPGSSLGGANKSDGVLMGTRVPVQYYRKGNNIIEKNILGQTKFCKKFFFISRVCKKGKQIVSFTVAMFK